VGVGALGHEPLGGRGMLRSWVVMMSQLGFSCQAAVVAFSSKAVWATGRWVVAIRAAWPAGTSAANWWRNLSGWMV
jgi:hypothetical protein